MRVAAFAEEGVRKDDPKKGETWVRGSYGTAHRVSNQTNLYFFGHPCQRRTSPETTGQSFSRKTHAGGHKSAYDPKKIFPAPAR